MQWRKYLVRQSKISRRSVILFFLLFIIHGALLAQTPKKNIGAADVHFAYIPLKHSNLIGPGVNIEVAVKRHLLTGFECTLALGQGDNAYQHAINHVQYEYLEMGWINEFRLIHKKRLALNLLVNNFYTTIELKDTGAPVQSSSSTNRTKEIGFSNYYSLQPGLRITVPIFKKTGTGPFVKATYHFLFGQPQFGENRQDFQSFMISTGFRLDI